MNLDPRTLLFSLVMINALMALSLLVAGYGLRGKQDGIGKWSAALLFETLAWMLVAARGHIPDIFSVAAANGVVAISHALILAAVCEFQKRRVPRWEYVVPVAFALAMAFAFPDDLRSRFVWGGLIYGLQMVLIAHALFSDKETRAGRAWRLLFGGTSLMLLVLVWRAVAALTVHGEFAQPQNLVSPQPVQIVAFISVMAAALVGSIGFVLMIKERTDNAMLLLAMTDSLTLIPNRRALMERAGQALARRNRTPLALLMLDVDFFKRINDTYGHQAGDEILRKIAERLSGRLRSYDLLGRYGGEEFCIVTPDTDMNGVMKLAEALRANIATAPFITAAGEFSMTISIGVSICPSEVTRKIEDMIEEADDALYTAKHTGRNQVVCFGIDNVAAAA